MINNKLRASLSDKSPFRQVRVSRHKMKLSDQVKPNGNVAQRQLPAPETQRHDFLDHSYAGLVIEHKTNTISNCTRRVVFWIIRDISHILTGARASFVLLAIVLATTLGLTSSLAHAELIIAGACSGKKAKAEGRTIPLEGYYQDYSKFAEDLYCVTHVKCVALGECKASSPAEQAAADKLKRELAAEESRLQRERKAKSAQAERERKQAEAATAAEKARREKLAAAEAKRLKLSAQDAKRLVETREDARKKMPAPPKKCTLEYPAYTQKLDFTPVILMKSKAERDYAAINRSTMCNGHPGELGPLQCENESDFFGTKYANCTAMKQCPARQESKPCNRTSIQ